MEESSNDYRVELSDIYSGPLDLLLYLVKKDEIAIHEISISRITEQFIGYIELLQMLDVNIASEFLVMAATLMHIKSHSLLPAGEGMEDGGEDDPKFELIQQLLEYKRYKDLTAALKGRGEDAARRFSRPKIRLADDDVNDLTLELGDVTVWDLLEKFSNLMSQTLMNEPSVIRDDERPISEYMDELMAGFDNAPCIYFHSLFATLRDKMVMIGYFLALLELVRSKKVKVQQDAGFDRIRISRYL